MSGGIYIPGMEMPEKCISCKLIRRCGENDLDYVCMPARIYVEDLTNAYKPRPDYCPLIPVPDHTPSYEDLLKAAKAMHTWIFLNSFDEQKAYDECHLSDEMNIALGYGGQFELRTTSPKEDEV